MTQKSCDSGIVDNKKKRSPMTNTREDRDIRKPGIFRQLARGPWHLFFVGVVVSSLAKTYVFPKSNPWVVGGALSLTALSGILVYLRLRRRRGANASQEPASTIDPQTDGSQQRAHSSTQPVFDLWTLAIVFTPAIAVSFARSQNWLGSNNPEKTDVLVTLGIVFIAAVSRLWWRDRKGQRRDARVQKKGRE